jgi:hypothetical protein
MTITDAFLLAKYLAGSDAEVQKMTIKDFAYRVAFDMWDRKVSNQPRNEILDGILAIATDCPTTVGGTTSSSSDKTASSLEWYHVQKSHQISLTDQKDNNGKPCRRACTIKAAGCESVGDERKAVSKECKHPACMSITNSSKNKYGQTQGTFICSNFECQKEHWDRIAKQVRGA